MWTIPQVLAFLTLAGYGLVVVIAVVGLWDKVYLVNVAKRFTVLGRLWSYGRESALGLSWIVAIVASLGSLYLSEISHFEPCTFCWWQRVAMYPLVVILGIGTIRSDHSVRLYALPLAGIGAALAGYHLLLQRVPEFQGATECSAEAPCNVMWLSEFGFVSIPMMSLGAFLLIAVLLFVSSEEAEHDSVGDGKIKRKC